MHEALDDPRVTTLVGRKSAQIAWTDGVVMNYIGRRIHQDPCAIVVMFSTDKAAKAFNREKLVPAITDTPVLAERIPVHKTRDPDNGHDFKGFPGGFIKLVGSNSPDGVKGTPAPVVIVEEPDDSAGNVKGQGDAIALLGERIKTFRRRKIIFGGTPTIEGFSKVEEAYAASDQREFWVPCPSCDELQLLVWSQVTWSRDPALRHEVYGDAVPDSARYCCAHCGSLWTDREKNQAVRDAKRRGGGWRASAAFNGTAGFSINELYSPFPGSVLAELVRKRLRAEHALARGDDRLMRAFRNSTEGRAYAYSSTIPSAKVLQDRAEHYAELTVPRGGVVLTAGVDVQHDRLAVVLRAWGRGEESWLVWWGEIYGRTLVLRWGEDGGIDREASGAWAELDELLGGAFPHAGGGFLRVRAASIDSGDGQLTDTVYSYVRRRQARGFLAIKGDGRDPKRDIFSPPKLSIDVNGRHKPHPSGVRPYLVGTNVAKDLIFGVDAQGGRIKLQGDGPARLHWYRTVRPDYWDQITAEVKVPHKTIPGRKVWACQAGRRNEATDCEVYALHAARSLKVNLWTEARWEAEEAALRQPTLFADAARVQPVRAPGAAVHPDAPAADEPDNPPERAGAGDGAEEGTAEKPGPGKPETAPGGPRRTLQPATPVRRASGWSATNWKR